MTTEVLRYVAFAASVDGGNPAGVVLDAAGLGDDDMLRVAGEVGFSETAFVTKTDGDRLTLRYFSPVAEVPFCGHATIATAVALYERNGLRSMVFATRAGDVSLRVTEDASGAPTASFTSVEPSVRDLAPGVVDRLLSLFGLTAGDLDARYPVREAFAGNWHPILVLADRDTFGQFRYAPADVAALMREQGWAGTITVLHEVTPGEYAARNVFASGRVNEDPATGSAAAAVGGYLRELGLVPANRMVHFHQGSHIGRPCLVTATIPETGGIIVSGTANPIDG